MVSKTDESNMNVNLANTRNRFFSFLLAIHLLLIFLPLISVSSFILFQVALCICGFLLFGKVFAYKSFRLLVLFFLIGLVYSALGFGLSSNSFILDFVDLVTAVVVCNSLFFLSYKQLKSLLVLLLLLLSFTLISSFFALDAGMSLRQYGSNSGVSPIWYVFGQISYGLGESLAILLPMLFILLMEVRKRLLKLILFVIIISGIVLQYLATFTTSCLITVLACIIVWLYWNIKHAKKGSTYISIIVILISLYLIFPALNTLLDNDQFSAKMDDVSESVVSNNSVGQVEGRLSLYSRSVQVWLRHPLLGGGTLPVDIGGLYRYDDSTVGLHSTLLDFLGLYGVFSILLFVGWSKTYFYYIKRFVYSHKGYFIIVYFAMFFLLLLKGPVSLGLNFLVSIEFMGLVCMYLSINNSKWEKE